MHPLIFIRLSLSLALFIACVFACAVYCEAKRDQVTLGAAIAAAATFACAIHFANSATALELWRQPGARRQPLSQDHDPELPSYHDTLATAGFLKEPPACPRH